MRQNYIVSNHKPTAVDNCVAGSFTGPNDLNLIISKGTYLEIYIVTSDGLKLLKEYPINGKIISLQLFKFWATTSTKKNPPTIQFKEYLFILTHKYNVCILECQKDSNDIIQITTRAFGNVQEKIGRPSETGMIASIDPEGRVIGLRLYDGLYKVINLTEQNFSLNSTAMNEESQLKSDKSTPTNMGTFEFNLPDSKKELKTFNVNIEERKIIDMTFLEGFEVPTLGLINQDSEGRHFRTYRLGLIDRELSRGPWNENNIEAEASLLIPVPVLLGGGVIIVGQESIMYYRGDNSTSFAIRPPVMKQYAVTCYGKIDPNGSRYLLGDMGGRLFMLLLESDGSDTHNAASANKARGALDILNAANPVVNSMAGFTVTNMRLELLGEVSIPECLTYLDNGVVYVGSKLGDSQLIKLRSTPINKTPGLMLSGNTDYMQPLGHAGGGGLIDKFGGIYNSSGMSYVEVLETYTNLGPIVDMIVVDPEKTGHKDQLVTCSNAFKDGSLRILRDGIGFSQIAALELPSGIRGLWTLKNSVTRADSYLVIAFSDLTTRVIAFESSPEINGTNTSNSEEMVEEIDMPGLETRDTSTLWCGDVYNHNVLQVTTTKGCRLLDRINSNVLREWYIPNHKNADPTQMEISENFDSSVDDLQSSTRTNNGHFLTLSACNPYQLVLASGRDLYYIEITKNDLVLKAFKRFVNEISCLNINPLPNIKASNDKTAANKSEWSNFCAVGFWTETSVKIVNLPDLQCVFEEFLPKTDVVPRSIVMCHLKDDEEDFSGSANVVVNNSDLQLHNSPNPQSNSNGLMNASLIQDGVEGGKTMQYYEHLKKGCYLLVALGDGTLYHLNIDPLTGHLSERKKMSVGTRPPSLKLFGTPASPGVSTSHQSQLIHQQNVLVCSDRPAVIYRRNKKLIVSDVNVDEISFATPFDSPSYPDSIILVPSPGSGLVIIGKIDEIRKLHIRTIPLYESPRRVAYQTSSHTFGVLCVRSDIHNGTTYVPVKPAESVSVRAARHSSASTFRGGSNSSSNTNGTSNATKTAHAQTQFGASGASNNNANYYSFEANSTFPTSAGFTFGSQQLQQQDANRGGASMALSNYNNGTYGDEMEAHSFVILDAHTFEPLWAHHFQPFEYATSLISCQLQAQPGLPDGSLVPTALKEFYIVGTAMVYPDDAEPKTGKILVFEYGNDNHININNNNKSGNSVITGDSNKISADVKQELDENNLSKVTPQQITLGGEGFRKLTLVSEKEISGAPYSLSQFPHPTSGITTDSELSTVQPPPKLLASVNSTVRLFEWLPADNELRLECSHFNNILALYLKTRGDFVLVGDLMRSLTLLNYKPLEGNFEEIARDYNPSWTSAIEIIDNSCESFLAADNSLNLFVCRTKEESDSLDDKDDEVLNAMDTTDPKPEGEGSTPTTSGTRKTGQKIDTGRGKRHPSGNHGANNPTTTTRPAANTHIAGANGPPSATLLDDERRYLYPTGVFHLAEFVNSIKKGSLVSKNSSGDVTFDIDSLLMGTISGSVHLMVQIPARIFGLLDRLQRHMAKSIPTLGKMSHEVFRSFHTEQKNERARGFIDGDLVETFLDLSPADKKRIVEKLVSDKVSVNSYLKQSSSFNDTTSNVGAKKITTFASSSLVETKNAMPVSPLISVDDVTRIIEELARLH